MTIREESPSISEETRKRIEENLRDWDDPNSEVRKRFLAAQEKWDEVLRPLEDAIIASEQLTEDDFAIRINTRD
jgi:hypothetical protein